MPTRHDLLAILAHHVGRDNGITAEALGRALMVEPRRVRQLVTDAIEEGAGIVGGPATGYYIAATAEDVAESIAFHRRRARHELRKASRLRRLVLPDFFQRKLPT